LRLTHRRKESTSFEKKSKNFCPFGVRVVVTLTLYKQEFFGFFKKNCLLSAACRPATHWLLTAGG
jgi:hypothetical protein